MGTTMISGSETKALACVTVTYNPDITILTEQLRSLPESAHKIIIDNASSPQTRDELVQLQTQFARIHVYFNEDNTGLAAALNQGARIAQSLIPTDGYILLLDQDSEPQPGSIETLITGYESLRESGEKVGAVGPTLQDAETGLIHGFHQQTRWRWRRAYPAITEKNPVPCANLNGSGTLMTLELYLALGGLDEAFFIDHVDTEWSFRLLAAGYSLRGVPSAVFVHRMGQASIRYWLFCWRLWPSRSPQRHYYLFRNAVWLMRRDYVPKVWKFWGVVKLITSIVITLVIDPKRFPQLNCIINGLMVGIRFNAVAQQKNRAHK